VAPATASGLRQFFWKLSLFAPLLLGMAAVNWYVDPSLIFSKRPLQQLWAERIVELNCAGRNVLMNSVGDERLLQRVWLTHVAARPDVLVLGSSRTMNHTPLVRRGTLYNCSVSGASLQDYLAICQLYWEKGLAPRKILLGVDPWVFNRHNGQGRWRSLEAECDRGLVRLGLRPPETRHLLSSAESDRLWELFSPSYFQACCRSLLRKRHAARPTGGDADGGGAGDLPTLTDQSLADVMVRFPDGSLEHDAAMLAASPAAVRKEAVKYARTDPVYGLARYAELDPELTRQFERFMDQLAADGTEVVLYLPPYHPAAYEIIVGNPRYKIVRRVEAYFRAFAQRRQLRLVGSYDPSACGVPERDFVDATHLRREVLPRLVGSSLEPPAAGAH
jgi:hypothetical protein